MSKEEKWYIGIDFGTSNTFVAAYEATSGKAYWGSHLGKNMSDGYSNIPTLIAQDVLLKTEKEKSDGKIDEYPYYVGVETALHPILRPFKGLKNAAREITPNNGMFGRNAIEYPFERCGLNSTLELGNKDYSLTRRVRDLLIEFLKKVVHIDDATLGIDKDTVQQIVIGQPVVNGRIESSDGSKAEYAETLKELLSECFFGQENSKDKTNFKKNKIIVKAEPELAGITYLYSESNMEEKKVLVIDIGGGTTDFSILEHTSEKIEATNIGSCEIAGNAIDDLIFNLLPDNIPHSRSLCKNRKENLFLKGQDTTFIVPRSTEELEDLGNIAVFESGSNQYHLHYAEKTYGNCIVLSTGQLFKEGSEIKKGKSITDVFNDIGKALRKALDDSVIVGINKVLFVGGTSIITPLRETLVEIVTDTGKAYCVKGFNPKTDVVTMFGEDTRTVKVDWDVPAYITCYNAVAIGACIKAMDKKIRIKPMMKALICGSAERVWETTTNSIIIGTDRGAAFAWLVFSKSDLDTWVYVYDQLTVEISIDGSYYKTLTITKEQCQTLKYITIVAIMREEKIEFKAYETDTAESLKKANSLYEIKIL